MMRALSIAPWACFAVAATIAFASGIAGAYAHVAVMLLHRVAEVLP